jgi:mannose-6-phosphate isomerase
MSKDALTPLRFAPIFKPALWGGNRLRTLLGAPPSDEPTGEAWVLSDFRDAISVVTEGPRAGTTLRQLMEEDPQRIVGSAATSNGRFPLLLKFIQARYPLSVQVHPTDAKARELEGPSAVGKTEAWVILEAAPGSRLYTGLYHGVTPDRLRKAVQTGKLEDVLYTHEALSGDCVFLRAGTVHAIGAGVLLFEVQQASDVTYRLYDWGRVDPKTGKPRELHLEKALASADFSAGPCRPESVTDEAHGRVRRAPLVDQCAYFSLGRWEANRPFRAGAAGRCRVLVGTGGRATIRHAGAEYLIGVGDVWLLPAEVGTCECVPHGEVTILECGLPE